NYDLEKDFEAFYQLTTDNILTAKVADDQAKFNVSKTNHVNMIKYIRKVNRSLIDHLINETLRTSDYRLENDQEDQEDNIESKLGEINLSLYKITTKQLKNQLIPTIIYSNYRKSFNRTLERIYKEQIEQTIDLNQIRASINGTVRDGLTEEYQGSALRTAMQCLTGAAGANNVPADFCEKQLT
ncbi:unnamed protein product, partial [Rotaria socialis]